MSVGLYGITYTGITDVRVGDTPTYGRTSSGYGGKIPTRFMVRTPGNGRWRRVYMMQYGNAGTAYVVVDGRDMVLDTDAEHRIGAAAYGAV